MINYPLVSFIIIARNASNNLSDVLSDFISQDYPKEKLELLLVDGGSTDDTRIIMEQFANCHKGLSVKVLENHSKILSCGWNVALSEAKGDIIIRVDAHCEIQQDFIKKNIRSILNGEKIVGGAVITKKPKSLWGNLLFLAERSMFGSGVADFRNMGPPRYLDTVGYAAYSREVFELIGGYDDRLVRNQDLEIHYRMRKAGYRFFFNPEIVSYHKARPSLREMLRQKWNDGKWVGLLLGIRPQCLCFYHLVPGLFLSAAISLTILGMFWSKIPIIILCSFYGLGSIFFMYKEMIDIHFKLKSLCLLLPIIFLLIHISYGLGTWYGFINIPIFAFKNRTYNLPWPIK